MGITYNAGSVSRNGLVFHFDAANPKCYPGTGTTFNDLSSTGANGSITGATFVSSNGGYFDFNGTSDFMTFTGHLSEMTTDAWTCEITFDIDTNTGIQGLLHIGSFTGSYFDSGFVSGQANGSNTGSPAGAAILTNTWYHYVVSFEPGVRYLGYLNGVEVFNVSTVDTTSTFGATGDIGSRVGSNDFFNGQIANAKLYNRVVSLGEVQQNYISLAGRFGI